jgi:hypothetical protein
MDRDLPVVVSALGFTFGCLILVFGAVLRDKYAYSASYNNALHVHASVSLIIIVGGVIAVLGLAGMVRSLVQR